MTPRLPFLAIVGLAIAGAVLASEGGRGDGDDPAGAGLQPDPAVAIESPSATWFCAGGSAAGAPGEGFADHTVIVTAGPEPVTGRVSVIAGDHAPPPATANGTTSTTSSDPSTSDSSTSTSSTTTTAPTTSTTVAIRSAPTAGVGDGMHGAAGDEADGEQRFSIGAGEQVRFRLADVVQAPLAAAIVELDPETPLTVPPPTRATEPAEPPAATVEHEVRGPRGADTAPCTARSAATWHFAWGATTRDADEQLVLFNPFPNDVAVDAVFSTDRGVREPQRWQGLTVPARSVVAVDVGDDVTRRDHVAASLHVRGGRLVVARVQAFDGQLGAAGMSVATGVPEAGLDWSFAEGRVEPGDAARIVLYNPGTTVAEMEVVVEVGEEEVDYQPEPFGVTVRPGRYEVLDLAEQARVPKGLAQTVQVRSTNGVPVVVERVTGTPDPGAGPSVDGHPPFRLDTDTPLLTP